MWFLTTPTVVVERLSGYRLRMANARPGRKIIFFIVVLIAAAVLGTFIIVGALSGGDAEQGDQNDQPPASSTGP